MLCNPTLIAPCVPGPPAQTAWTGHVCPSPRRRGIGSSAHSFVDVRLFFAPAARRCRSSEQARRPFSSTEQTTESPSRGLAGSRKLRYLSHSVWQEAAKLPGAHSAASYALDALARPAPPRPVGHVRYFRLFLFPEGELASPAAEIHPHCTRFPTGRHRLAFLSCPGKSMASR
jgi:hypothetical protein